MDQVILGLAGIAIGTLVAAHGVRVFYLLLPLWGFLAGVVLGAQAVAAVAGDGIFATLLGWATGLGLGVFFAILAGAWFWAAVVILAAGVGAAIGSGILVALGFDPGLLTLAAGLALGAALAVLAVALDAPTLLVALLTSFGGAAYGVAGAYLLLGVIARSDLAGGPLAALREHPVGVVAWIALGTLALGYQLLEARAQRADLLASILPARP